MGDTENYLDLLSEPPAAVADPGPLLFKDDTQVKVLYANLHKDRSSDGIGSISVVARSHTSAIYDMELAGELLDDDAELDGDRTWAGADPADVAARSGR